MKRILFLASALLLISANTFAAPPGDQPSTTEAFVEKSIEVKEVYTSQIGVRELTGKNDGVQVQAYLKTVGLGKGYAWCAAFVKWCFLQVGIKTPTNGMAASFHNPKRLVYFKSRFLHDPQPGDVFTLYYPHLKRIGHTGFYDGRLNKSIYYTVEGNTNGAGSREGDGVYRKYRSFKATHSISRWL
ncbi:MAG TPA: CHAP domain-containing protein [Chitinophagaceae bacterium]|nr:CHAP domain-containing protein [Chitinophagaceae bacterium]